jgi:hypothetical protein
MFSMSNSEGKTALSERKKNSFRTKGRTSKLVKRNKMEMHKKSVINNEINVINITNKTSDKLKLSSKSKE